MQGRRSDSSTLVQNSSRSKCVSAVSTCRAQAWLPCPGSSGSSAQSQAQSEDALPWVPTRLTGLSEPGRHLGSRGAVITRSLHRTLTAPAVSPAKLATDA